ncbi:MAG TPA: hypothetical protein VFG69_07535, partial [Nannocystaceae bacterium]|nr:hypothetical protein [Nannocystaceae bacterium]
MRRLWFPWLVGAGVGLAWACGDGRGANDCLVGSSGCPCTSGQGCDPGLTCFSGTCAPNGGDDDGTAGDGSASVSTSASASATQGSADDANDDVAESTAGPGDTSGGGDGPK